MTQKARKRIFALLRVAVCVVALGYVLHGVSLHDQVVLEDGDRVRLLGEAGKTITVLQDGYEVALPRDRIARDDEGQERISYGLSGAIRRSNPRTLLLCLVLFGPVPLFQSLRFLWMLRAQEIRISYWESVKLSFAGNFLNFFVVGTTGGDVAKAYYVSLHTARKTEAVTTVLLDRVVGLAGLLTTGGLVIFLSTRDPQLLAVGYVIAAVWLALLAAAVLLGSRRLRQWLGSRSWVMRLISMADQAAAAPDAEAGRLRRALAWGYGQARKAELATHRLLRHKLLVFGALMATVVLQALAVSDFVLICHALDMDFSGGKVWDYYAAIATGLIVAAVPISPQGLGPTEATYKHFLLGTHGASSQILCMAMAIRLVQLAWALPGLLVAMTGSYRPQGDAPAAGARQGPLRPES